MAQIGINANEIDTTDEYAPLPAGKYKAIVLDSELKATNAGTGDYYKFELDIIEGDYKGRKVWYNVTRTNPNQTAVSIGQKNLARLMESIGKPMAQSTEELHNIPFVVDLKVRKSEEYGDQNDVKGVYPLSEASATPAAQPSTGGDNKPAWSQ